MTNAVLLRNVPLVVRDVSSGGCLVESRTPLQVGSVGWLEVEFEGERRFEWFRVARVYTAGADTFLAGAEFLPLAAAGPDALRSAIGRLRRSAFPRGGQKAASASSHDPASSATEVGGAAAESSSVTGNSARKIVNFFRRRPQRT